MNAKPLRFLALGDSYTIGESVDLAQGWPAQLRAALLLQGFRLAAPQIIARTGWTTGDLLAALDQTLPSGPFDLVSLLIGVNNQYQDRDLTSYRREFHSLLGRAIHFGNGDPAKVLVLSIPDWGVTPFAAGRDPAQIRVQIDQFNQINQAESQAASVNYCDITPLSRQAAHDPGLLAADGLHPSAKMYAAWIELLLPQTLERLLVT